VSIQKQIKKEIRRIERYELEHRSGLERTCSLLLTVATLFSLTGLGHDAQKQLARRDVIAQVMPVFNPAEKNETVRMPIKFDGGLRATSTVGG